MHFFLNLQNRKNFGGNVSHPQHMPYKLVLWVTILAKQKKKEHRGARRPAFRIFFPGSLVITQFQCLPSYKKTKEMWTSYGTDERERDH